MMDYILVEHSEVEDEDDVEKVYSEIDENRKEHRRVEFYPSGLCFAYGGEHGHEEVLDTLPEDLHDLETDEYTKVRHVRPKIFEEIWNHAAESTDSVMGLLL